MCTNDLYTCKDLSQINCTLACSTLGYVPCKNYLDRKVCENVLRKLDQKSNRFFDSGAIVNDKSQKGLFSWMPSESIFLPGKQLFHRILLKLISLISYSFKALGFFIVVSVLFVSFLIYTFHHKRIKKVKLKVSLDDSNTNLDRRRSSSCSSSDSNYNYPNLRHLESHPFKSVEGNMYSTQIKDECGHVKACNVDVSWLLLFLPELKLCN